MKQHSSFFPGAAAIRVLKADSKGCEASKGAIGWMSSRFLEPVEPRNA